ncbi:MAG: bestrophin family ion channel [Planctomycetota bacterium]|nr:bestrophin family ion channel [Planctomycetota bacterium]
MIVRKHLRWRRVLCRSKGFLAYIGILSTVVFGVHEAAHESIIGNVLGPVLIHLPFGVVATLATALAIFLAFRNNSAYDRWWEARKIWGGIVNASRTFGRQITSLTILSEQPADAVAAYRKEMVYRHLAWVHALRKQLRREEAWDELQPLLPPEEFQWMMDRQNRATQLVQKQGQRLAEGRRDGQLYETRYHEMLDETLTSLYDLQGRAERIKNTPLPRQYDYFPRVFLFLFVTLLPSGMITELEKVGSAWMVIPLATMVSYMFYILMRVGEFNEDPFEGRFSDTPMTALCRTIEIDMREQLGETNLPPKLEPVDGILM